MPSPNLLTLLLFVFATLLPLSALARVELGIDVLEKEGFARLKGKRVGLITNHTGINSRGIKTRKLLHDAKNVRLVALFAPEHGLDGKILAGKYVPHRKDPLTGLTVHSLYGPTRKPTPAMLKGIDTLVFDMQDIGSRSYTYISTMAKCMEAAGENGIQLIVLDRPNPLGGIRVEGPPVDSGWISFIGQFPIPYCHGMTTGELAEMANAKGWTKPRSRTSVVKMRGWRRDMTWNQTGLPWIATSPNIPYSYSPFYYAATAIVGGIPGFDLGCGGPRPFQYAATKHLNASKFANQMSGLGMPGVTFTPYAKGGFQGINLDIRPNHETPLSAINVYILSAAQKVAPRSLFSHPPSRYDIFYKCYGSDSIKKAIESGTPPGRIIAAWSIHNTRFMAERRPFLLY